MAKSSKHIVRTYHPVVRSELGLLVLPALVIGGLVWVLLDLQARSCACESGELLDWWHWAGAIGFPSLWFLAAVVKTQLMRRYRVTLDSVQTERGLIRRDSTEMSLRDVRHIELHQSLLDRLFAMGDVTFATEPEGGARVVFHNVHRPKAVRAFVKDLLDRMKDGALSASDVAGLISADGSASPSGAVGEDAPAPAKVEAPRARKPRAEGTAPMTRARADDAGSGGGDRDELYRLLAEQDADGKADEGGE